MTNEKIVVHFDDEDVLELAPAYLANRRKNMAVLQDALAQRDFETLFSLGHKMKGSGGGYGFERISEIGGHLESAAKAQDALAAEQTIAELQDYLDRVEIAG